MNIISAKDFFDSNLHRIFHRVKEIKEIINKQGFYQQLYRGLPPKVALVFLEPSTRTSGSFAEAARRLGYDCQIISGAEGTSLAKNESVANTTRMLSKNNQGADIIVLRTKVEGAPRFAAEIMAKEGCKTAVINAGDGANQHPTQALVDWFTILECGKNIPAMTLGFVGDSKTSRVAHSDLEMAQSLGVRKIRLVSVPEFKAQNKYKHGFSEVIEGDDIGLLRDCDAIIVLRVQEERFSDQMELKKVKGKFRITRQIINQCKKDVIIMHPLPCLDEIDPALYDDRVHFIAFKQAENGVPVRTHLLSLVYDKFEAMLFDHRSRVNVKEIIRMSVEEYFKKKKKQEHYFRPVWNGTVVDHILRGKGLNVCELLTKSAIDNPSVRHLIQGVPSQKLPNGKDVLILENYFIRENRDFLAAIATLYGPDLTIHEIKDGWYSKFKIDTAEVVCKLLKCPNPACITNQPFEPEAITTFFRLHNNDLKCKYCEREFSSRELEPI